MSRIPLSCLALLVLLVPTSPLSAAEARSTSCVILDSQGSPSRLPADALGRLLRSQPTCPGNVLEFRSLLEGSGLKLSPYLVGNRGFHNPDAGSFSIFETAIGRTGAIEVRKGEFFFGHFTAPSDSLLVLDQTPSEGSLMIEALAWDAVHGEFNFYELRGQGERGAWFYRGNSRDIFLDNATLHRQADPSNPSFGRRLRCSGCHLNGGPILKELAPSHNDWWQPARSLPLGGRSPDSNLQPIFQSLQPVDALAQAVETGLEKLARRGGMGARLSLPERLRPLFCPLELNLEADLLPLADAADFISPPSAFFVDPRLASAPLRASKNDYVAALQTVDSRFPETSHQDADHAWLAPVKARSDQIAVKALVAAGVIDDEFVADVLAVDLGRPFASPDRCGLLRWVPEQPTRDWRQTFVARLRAAGTASATALATHLTDPVYQASLHRERARAFLSACAKRLQTREGVTELVKVLGQRRAEISGLEISRNPLGQILEPGFRVIFPVFQSVPDAKTLDLDCRPVEADASRPITLP